MIAYILRLWFTLAGATPDAALELAQRACEITLYAVIAPDVHDDSTTPVGEAGCNAICRSAAP